MTDTIARELISGTIDISAPPERVWAIVSDLTRMGEWSPQCRKMIIRGGGPIGVGTRTINVNRRGLLVWPTRSKVTIFEAPSRLEFKVAENGAYWRYELEPTDDGGTRVVESRRAPHGVTTLSARLQKIFLGGMRPFEAELERGIATTLERLKAEAEAS